MVKISKIFPQNTTLYHFVDNFERNKYITSFTIFKKPLFNKGYRAFIVLINKWDKVEKRIHSNLLKKVEFNPADCLIFWYF